MEGQKDRPWLTQNCFFLVTRLDFSWNSTWLQVLKHDAAMDQYLLIPFLVGWTSIYQLFWCSPGVQGFDTLPCNKSCYVLLQSINGLVAQGNTETIRNPVSPRSWDWLQVGPDAGHGACFFWGAISMGAKNRASQNEDVGDSDLTNQEWILWFVMFCIVIFTTHSLQF